MSARANYFKIGLFLIVGTVLLIAGTVVFGVGALFREYAYMETYYDESVQGLSEGSPVKYRGVQIGFVDRISYCRREYRLDQGDPDYDRHTRYVYVRVALYPEIIEERGSPVEVREMLSTMVDRGLRVRLTSLGLTGAVYMEVDYLDVSLNRPLSISWKPNHYYVPSAPSTLLELSESITTILLKLKDVPYVDIANNIDGLLAATRTIAEGVDTALIQKDVAAILHDVGSVTTRIRELLEDEELGHLAARVNSATFAVEDVASGIDEVLTRSDLTTELPRLLAQVRQAVQRFNRILGHQQGDFEVIVKNLRVFTTDLRRISDDLKKNPARVLFGAPPPTKESEE